VLFTSYILGEEGEAAVVTFDDDVVLRQEFTSDADTIIRTLERLPAGGRRTRLSDGLEEAVAMLSNRPPGRRRVIIAISEAHDDASRALLGVPLRRAQLFEISVYTIGLDRVQAELRRRPEDTPVKPSATPPGVFAGPPRPGSVQTPTTETMEQYNRVDIGNAVETMVTTLGQTVGSDILEVYSAGTGGLSYAPQNQSALENDLNRIGQDLHSQYQITYQPSNGEQQGFHRIEVRVSRPGVSIRTRSGYYVGPPL